MTASPGSVAAQPGLDKRFPDFYLVGHAKSGTTALYEMLRRHPQIYMSGVKEPQYFARNPEPRSELNPFERTGKRDETLDEYLSLFADARADQLIGDASTFYLWSHRAPARIADANPAARIIAILREPASFVRSLHLQMLQNNTETEKDLRAALALEQDRREGRRIPPRAHWPEALIYSERVHYIDQLRRYHSIFGEDRVLVLIYDDFRIDNEGTLHKVFTFLGVDESHRPARVDANPSVEVRSVRLYTLVRDVSGGRRPAARAARATVKAFTTGGMRRAVLYPLRRRLVFRDPVPPDDAMIAELRTRFRGEVEAVSEYLGRDLVAQWGYDVAG